MRINERKKHTKKVYIVIAIVLLLIFSALVGYFVLSLTNKNNDTVDDSEITNPAIETTTNLDSTNQIIRESEKDPLQNDSADIDQNSLTGYITFKSITDGNLQIRVQIEQYLTSGTCKITIGNYTEQVDIITNPSSSTCEGWEIPITSIGSGQQNITIDISSGNNSLTLTDGITI